MNWISVLEKKPPEGSEVVILYTSGSMTIAKYDGLYFAEDGLLVEDISHWLKIPNHPFEKVCYNYEDLPVEELITTL